MVHTCINCGLDGAVMVNFMLGSVFLSVHCSLWLPNPYPYCLDRGFSSIHRWRDRWLLVAVPQQDSSPHRARNYDWSWLLIIDTGSHLCTFFDFWNGLMYCNDVPMLNLPPTGSNQNSFARPQPTMNNPNQKRRRKACPNMLFQFRLGGFLSPPPDMLCTVDNWSLQLTL